MSECWRRTEFVTKRAHQGVPEAGLTSRRGVLLPLSDCVERVPMTLRLGTGTRAKAYPSCSERGDPAPSGICTRVSRGLPSCGNGRRLCCYYTNGAQRSACKQPTFHTPYPPTQVGHARNPAGCVGDACPPDLHDIMRCTDKCTFNRARPPEGERRSCLPVCCKSLAYDQIMASHDG